jgi:hypothetical protein
MSSFMVFGSRRISLAERSRSSFSLVIFILCAGGDLSPSSDDVDEGCQWEIQTDEDWVFSGTHRFEETHFLLERRVCVYHKR